MKRAIVLLLIAAAVLSSCNNIQDQSSVSNSAYESSSAAKDKTSKAESPDSGVINEFEAKITDYSDGILTYVTDTEHKAVMDPRCFENDIYIKGLNLLSELIICNRYSEEIYGKIKLSADGTKVVSCDVISLNGDDFNNTMLSDDKLTSIEEDEVNMRRIKGSVYELYNDNGSITADLNDLDNIYKADFPDSLERIVFSGYRFNSGNFIIQNISEFSGIDEEMGSYIYDPVTNLDKYSFFATVQSLSEERASVILNDGVTVYDIPTYYNDGMIKENMQVMITLNAAPSLFGSGEKYKDDFAVFYTDPDIYNYGGRDFNTLAYAKHSSDNISEFVYTTIDEIQ